MTHVLAIVGLSIACVLWFLLQRNAPEGCQQTGACGACRNREQGGSCKREAEAGHGA